MTKCIWCKYTYSLFTPIRSMQSHSMLHRWCGLQSYLNKLHRLHEYHSKHYLCDIFLEAHLTTIRCLRPLHQHPCREFNAIISVCCRITSEVWNKKIPEASLQAFVFQTTFRHRWDDSATTTRTSLPGQQNRADRFHLKSVCDVILIQNWIRHAEWQNCIESCSLLHPLGLRNATDWFSFSFL